MICCAESTPRAGHFGQALHRIVVVSEQLRHLLIELGEVVFDQAQFIECQLHQLPIHRMKIRARPEGVAQLLGCCPQSLIGQGGQRRRIRFTVADRMQHATRAGAQQVRHDTRDLDVGFFRSASSRLWSCTRLRVI